MTMDTLDLRLIDLTRSMFVTTLLVAGPALVAGLVVGLAVSLLQALTSIQEQTLSLVPKVLATAAVTLLLLAPLIEVLREYTLGILAQLAEFGLS
jgi:flagellar biosynthetic protein FliQ